MRVILKDSCPVELIHAQCSCVAGTALCNHTVALLYQSAHYSQLKTPVVPPVLSCTESEQCWHEPRTMGVKPGKTKPVDKMVVLSARPKPTQTTMADGVRSTLYKAYQGELPDLSLLQVSEIYKDMACAPLITTMGISSEVLLVDSALGKVQAGSPLSYQQPLITSRQITFHPDAPPPPPLPLQHYRLDPSNCMFVCSEKEQLFIASLETTWDMAHKIEAATKDQSMVSEWHQLRRPRLTSSHFREVCHVRGPTSAEHLADRILRGTPQTLVMKRGLEMEMEAGAVRVLSEQSCELLTMWVRHPP
ncbi:uncharacterized protein LOC133111208 isoform X2 [Conger conger]|uniref:uncharacterized protein LOC133111208 isoform X2 n=1 Tax=Conger conger TaxID=82655 RepID=UPI002A5A81CC|nr:uncharacterized protein LOC133111208 isoform X2 [Conger conger]